MSARETSLASVLAGFLTTPDLWTGVTEHYLKALDQIDDGGQDQRRGRGRERQQRADDLAEWHAMLVDRLVGSEHEPLLDRLVTHPALAGPGLTFVQARLARERGQLESAHTLIGQCLRSLPASPEFRTFAEQIEADMSPEEHDNPTPTRWSRPRPSGGCTARTATAGSPGRCRHPSRQG